jgi:hypothetical protein
MSELLDLTPVQRHACAGFVTLDDQVTMRSRIAVQRGPPIQASSDRGAFWLMDGFDERSGPSGLKDWHAGHSRCSTLACDLPA